MIKAEIIADSKNNQTGDRITTFVLEYPRFIHAELLTHRMFSKNSASSRAIPIEKFIEQVERNPVMPEFWGKNQSGMQAKEELNENDIWKANDIWHKAKNSAIEYAMQLDKLGLHKQITNRILEPWFHIRVILTGTDFENFFALRAHPDAQPEIQKLAYKMLELYNLSTPQTIYLHGWHIPFGDKIDDNKLCDLIERTWTKSDKTDDEVSLLYAKIKIAIARCARVSYFNFEGKDDYEADIKLCDKLFMNTPKHLSPTEHVAQALYNPTRIGNFRGWRQYRYFFNDQCLTDTRIKK